MRGLGNPTASTYGDGILFESSGGVTTSGTGTITLTGIATGTWNGIRINSTTVSTGSGDITLTGNSNSTSSYNGVRLHGSTAISTTGKVTLAGTGGTAHYGVWIIDTSSITAGGDISINGQNGTRNWGVSFHSTGTIQSTGGNIAITGAGTGGVFLRATSLVAANNASTPTSGGNITITGTGTSDYGVQQESGSITAFGAITVNGSSTGYRASYFGGTGINRAVGDISITSASTSGNNWGMYVDSDKVFQTTAGNIAITSSDEGGTYFYGKLIAANSESTPTSGGTITINASGSSSYGLQLNATSVIAHGAINITATNTSTNHAFRLEGASGSIKSNGDITIQAGNTSGNTGTWGLVVDTGASIQSVGGNIAITARGSSGGFYVASSATSIVAGNHLTAPTAGGNITLNTTGESGYGTQMVAGSLVANGTINLTSRGSDLGAYIYGTGLFRANGDITINTTSTSSWAFYQINSRFVQSIAGSISITANGGYGIYVDGGGIVAGNSTTAPTAGGAITINSATTGSNVAAAALRMDADNTKILAYGDISIYANGASAGLNVNGNGHGLLMYCNYQTIRSMNGNLAVTGYANRAVGTWDGGAGISGGITLWSSLDTLRAKGDITLKGVSMEGIGLYLTVVNGGSSSYGVISDTGNIVMDGLNNNSSFGATYIRLPVVASAGSIYISGAGGLNGIRQDAWQGNITAAGDIQLIGYAKTSDGLYFGVGGITSTGGNVTMSGYTPATNAASDYGIYSAAPSVSAANGSVIVQGAKITSAATGSGVFVNAATNTTGGLIDPIYAVADAANPAFGPAKGIKWLGNITANTSTGYIQIHSKAPEITGNMTAYGLALIGNNQDYSLTGTGSISAITASLGTGSLTYSNSGTLTIGSYGGVSGITAGTVTLTAAGLLGSNNISTTGGTITINPSTGPHDYSGVISGAVGLNKSGSGTQILSGANTYSGATNITGGVLRVTNSGGLGSSAGATTVSSGAALEISGGITLADALTISGTGVSSNGAVRSLSGANTLTGGITLGAATEMQVDADSLSITPSSGNAFSGAFGLTLQTDGAATVGGLMATGTGTLTKTGSADLYLTANNTLTGSTTISGGTLYLGTGSTAGTVAGAIVNNASLVVNRSNDLALSGVISGTGGLTKQGAGTLTLSGVNTYAGVNTVSGGGLQISSDSNLGLAPVALTAGKLVLNGGSLTASETFILNSNRGITLGADSTLSVASGKILTYSGVITDGAFSYALTKSGTGALVLGAAQTYNGLTSVTGGTLRLGANASLNGGAGALSLATGTTLDVQSNALTLGSLTMAGTAAIVNGSGSSSLTVTGTSVLANSITTSGHQVYNGAVTLAEDTNLVTTANGSITFNSTLDSVSAASPKNLSANISSSTYYWVDWTSVNDAAKTVTGSITIDGTVVTVVYSNPQGWAGVQTSGGINYWTGTPSPYTSASVANGPTTSDIIRLQYAGTQSISFSESVENIAFSVVSLNGNGYGFNQDFSIASYTGFNGAGTGYFTPSGTLSKSYDTATQQFRLLGTSGEPHGTIRFVNSTSNLSWSSLSNENWNGFTIGVNSATSTIGKLVLSGVAGGNAALGNITSNSGFKNTAEVTSAQSVAVTKTSQIGANINTTAGQTYGGDASLSGNATLSGTAINLGKVNLVSNGLTINNSDDSQITGVVSGNGSISKQGSGKLTLSAANTYSGGTTVSAGLLWVGASTVGSAGAITSSALGVGNVNVASGAAVNLAGYSLANTLNLSGSGIGSAGALYNSTTTAATLSGAITLAGATTIKGNAGDLTISGAVNGAYALTVSTTNKALSQSGIVGASAAPTSVTMDAGTGNVSLSAAQKVAGPLWVTGGGISLSGDLTVSTNDQLKLIASKDIVASAGVDLSTQGGNIVLSANSDASAGGAILMTGATVRSNGGNITLGGGTDGSGYAEGSADGAMGQRYRGLWLDQTTIDASGTSANGNVAIRGKGWQGANWVSPAAADYAIGVDVVTNTVIKTGGAGTLLIDGVGGKNNNSGSHSVGINLYNGLQIYSDSGAITLTGTAGTGLARENAGILMDGGSTASIYSTSGAITLTGRGASTDQGIKLNGGVNLGWNGSSGYTTGDITLNADAMTLGAGLSLKTSGVLTVQSVGNSFRSALEWPIANLTIGTTLGGLTLGKTTNTANITISSAQTVNGPVNIYGGTITINAPITTSSGTVTLKGTGNVVDGANGYVVADKLMLLGGAVTLDHASTNINTLAGSGLTSLSLVNADAFDVGTVGGVSGLASAGAVVLTASTGGITINQNISSGAANQTLQSAVTLGADATLTGATVSFAAVVNGAKAMTVAGNAKFDAAVGATTALSGLTVSGTTTLGASVRTTGLQTYAGAVTLAADATLTGSAVHLNSTVNGAKALTIAGDAVLGGAMGGVTRLSSLSISGTTSLGSNVSTTGAQIYTGAMTLTGHSTLTGSGLSLSSVSLGGDTLTMAEAGTGTISGTVTGTGGLTLSGTGALTLMGDNSYSGATLVSSGVLKVGSNTALGTTAGDTTVASSGTIDLLAVAVAGELLNLNGGTLKDATSSWSGDIVLGASSFIEVGSGDTLTLSGVVSGTGFGITKTGAGALVVTNTSTYTGNTTISAGLLQIGAGGSDGLLSGATAIVNNASLVINRSGTPQMDNVISGTGSVTKLGTGAVTFTGSNSYSGGTTVSEGVIAAGSATAFGSGRVTVSDGASLNLNGRTLANALTMTGAGYGTAGALFNSSVSAAAVSGAITLAGVTTIKNNGGLTLSGGVDGAYALTLNPTNSTPALVTMSGAVGGTTPLSSITANGPVSLAANVTTTGNQTWGAAVTLAANVEMTGGEMRFASVVNGAKTLMVTGDALFLDAVGASAALTSLSVSGVSNIGANITTSGTQTYAGALTLGAGSQLTASGLSAAAVDLTRHHLTVSEAGSGQITGLIAGTGSLTKAGAGTLTLSGTNDFTGGVAINAGTLKISADRNLGAVPGSANADALTFNGGTLQVTANTSLARERGVMLGSNGATFQIDPIVSVNYAGVVAGTGGLTKSGAGTLALNGHNTYSGGTAIGAGMVTLGHNAGLGTAAVSIASGAALDLNGKAIANALSVTGTGIGGGGAITNSSNSEATMVGAITLAADSSWVTGGAIKVTGAVDGDKALTVTGTGGLTLAGGVGQTTALTSVNISGAVTLGADVTTSGTQSYDGRVTVSAASTLSTTDSNVTFGSSVSLSDNLTVSTGAGAGAISVTGAIDGAKALSFSAGTGAITLSDLVGQSTRLGAVTLNSSGVTTLAKAVKVGSLTTNAGGTLVIDGGSVDTTGAQIYGEAVTLGADTTLKGSSINTQGTLAGGSNALTIDGAADIDGAYTGITNLSITGAANIGANITTSGTQSYDGAVTVSAASTLSTTDSNVTFGSSVSLADNLTVSTGAGAGAISVTGTIDGAKALSFSAGTGAITLSDLVGQSERLGAVTLNSSGVTTLAKAVKAARLTTNAEGTLVIDGGSVDTTGAQTYGEAITLGADTMLKGSSINTQGTLAGGNKTLTIDGAADIDGAYSGITNLRITDTANIGANITTSGTQTYGDAVTLSGGDRTLTGSTINTQSTLAGGGNALTIDGAADIGGAYTGLTNLSITGTANIGANITTSGTQTYAGVVTLSGGNRNLTGSTINTRSTMAGGGNALTITGAADIDGAYTDLTSLSVSGSSNIGANITSSGSQTYTGAVTLSGSDRTLTGSMINTRSTLAGGSNALTIAGAADIDGEYTGLTTLNISGTVNIGGNITTSAGQTYGGAVTISGADRRLTGATINTQSTLAGGNNALTIAGAADIDGAYTGLTTLSITGTANIGANITTSAGQTYAGAVTLSGGDRTLAGSTINTQSTLAGGSNALTIFGAADIDGAYTGITNLSITGAANIGANITTSGTQTYGGAVTISGADRTLAGTTINTQSTLAGGNNALTIAGAADIDAAYTGLTTLSIMGTANIGANVTTSGTQTYAGAVTLSGGDRTLTGTTVNTQSTLAGGSGALTISGAADIDGAYTGITTLSITGASNIGANITTSAGQTYTGAVTLSGGDRTLTGTTINSQSTLAGGSNALKISGAADIDSAYTGLTSLSITGTANIGANITTSGKQTYGGAVTVSKKLVLHTSNADVTFNGFVDSASDAAYALDVRSGTGVVEFVRSVGLTNPLQSLSTEEVAKAGLSQNIGTTKLGAQFGSFTTVGNQVFNNITMAEALDMRNPRDPGSAGVTVTTETGGTAVIYPVRMTSASGDLNFLGTVDGGGFAKTNMRSLQLNAAGQITFNDKVGFDASPNGNTSLMENYTRHYGIYRFDVTAPTINVLGDVAAYEEVAFNGSTYIGGTAYNGPYRRIYSMDPKITFNGRVDGYGGKDGFYTLDARAISLDSGLPEPEINFAEDVGSRRQLAGLIAIVARLDVVGVDRLSNGSVATREQTSYGVPTTANAGTIRFGGNVMTTEQQIYLANKFVIDTSSGANALEFNSESGDVNFTVGQGRMVSGSGGSPRIKFKNRPSSATISLLKSSGAVITSEPNELSELVKLRDTSKLSDAKLMDQNLDQRAGQSPTVEVGDLIPVNCNAIVDNNCTPEFNANKPILKN
ncbi:hypothetical protein B9Z45_14730 [Limnohabitans sp. 2KL-17]|uniref:autotransporter-associated beta strand repeat-containing protein n=1 Tax=Limnohabitans sp. 2KL-17 TaxID=1100704 RepID=UPI000D3940AF|nr:autotransporter-associated beta strand repeat-containing protein [Limnohabitans sp. 2KL-17]PUE51435.1 hypothetical protein B9Z45_14730 [Limnohabitans sp. 2KL-17]